MMMKVLTIHQKVFFNVLLMPLQQVTLLIIALLALFRHSTGTLT